jgi:hypothetical protein
VKKKKRLGSRDSGRGSQEERAASRSFDRLRMAKPQGRSKESGNVKKEKAVLVERAASWRELPGCERRAQPPFFR